MAMLGSRAAIHVLGVPVDCVDYLEAIERVKVLAGEPRPAAVSACNTHLVAEARRCRSFGDVLRGFDMNLPDGMPLLWVLRKRQLVLKDRVYGPYFMRDVLKYTPRPWRHFFFGGTDSCLEELRKRLPEFQPDIEIAGMYSPPFRKWTEEDQCDFARRINESNADFVWVALGGVRQERWIDENRHRFNRGVFLAVGDAFELLAGRRKFAPKWMQRAGLTWLYRLIQEPRRLWLRYLQYNSSFVWYTLRDTIVPSPLKEAVLSPGGRKIAFLGSRGTPARYAGFETVVQELGARLAERGNAVTVYNRSLHFPDRPPSHLGMSIVYVPAVPARAFETFVHTFLSALHAIRQRYDIIYLCGVGNAALAWLLRSKGAKVVINVDGIDFRRAKWSGFAKQWLKWSERWAVALADRVIADNQAVVEHYRRNYNFSPIHISYGALTNLEVITNGELLKWQLRPKGYLLFVGRLSPENEADTLIDAFVRTDIKMPLVIVGAPGYERNYYKLLQSKADSRVIFTGGVYGDGYRELSQHCLMFILPAAIEATRLVLLDQMGMGNAVVFKDSEATREVIGDAGMPFIGDESGDNLKAALETLAASPEQCGELGIRALSRAQQQFSWDRVTDAYTKIFDEIKPL